MKYFVSVKADPPVGEGTDKLMKDIDAFVERLKKSGALVDTGGLQGSESGTTLKLAGGKLSVTDGPFTETNEVTGGFIILKVKSKEEALGITKEFVSLHSCMGSAYKVETELRRMYSMEEFTPTETTN